MDDPFLDDQKASTQYASPEDVSEPMSRSIETTNPTVPTKAPRSDARSEERGNVRALRESLAAKQICPFCGSVNSAPAAGSPAVACPRCTMEDSAATRQATKARIGPWHVLQTRNPAAPGMRYATLLALVAKNQVTARSIIRGPTTQQLWRWAGHVRGLSREFGMCYSCGQALERTATHCPNCDRSQEPPANPDALLESRDSRASTTSAAAASGSHSISGAGSLAIADDTLTPDPYAARLPTVAASHAERLRNTGEYRPVDTRIETRTDLTSPARRRADGRVLSSMELAAALQVSPSETPAASAHPLRTTVLTLLIVALLAGAIVGYARPDLRHQTLSWIQDNFAPAQAKTKAASDDATDNALPSQNPQYPPQYSAQPDSSTGGSSNADRVASDAAPPISANAQSSDTPLSPTAIAPAAIAPAIPPATPAIPAPARPNPVPDSTADNNLASTEANEHPALSSDTATLRGSNTTKQIWELRGQAMDASSRSDWASAAKLYEQIETAPPELWPADTKIRLAIARRQLAAK